MAAEAGQRGPADGGAAPEGVGGERWWPVAVTVLAAAVLHVTLPVKYRVNPGWLTPAVALLLVAVLIVGDPGRIDRQRTWLRVVTGVIIVVITGANLFAGARLVADIISGNKLFANDAPALLAVGGVVWVTNVIAFALWFWDLDRGGAAARAHRPFENPAFVFPEMLHTDFVRGPWVPRFVDYLFLAFWTATAFSPTDVSAVKTWSKALMMLEAAMSLCLAALVIARAINVLQ